MEPFNEPFRLIHFGRQDCSDLHAWGPGIRENYIIHYILRGKGHLICGGKNYEVREGQSFLIRPNRLIHYYPDPGDPWEYAWADIDGDGVKKLIDGIFLFREKPVSPVIDGELRTLFTDGCELPNGSSTSEMYRRTGTLYLILSCYYAFSPAEPGQARDDIVNAAREWIGMNLPNPGLTVESLAAFLNVSRVTLYRKFREQLAMSPNRYLREQRLAKACVLLKSTSLSVKSVAFSVGFEDPLYFSKVFHGRYGVTPTEYRK